MNIKFIAVFGLIFLVACSESENSVSSAPVASQSIDATAKQNTQAKQAESPCISHPLYGYLYHATSNTHSALVLITS